MIRNTIVMTISVHQYNVILATKHVHMTLFSEFFIIWRQIGGCSRDRCVICSVFFYIFFFWKSWGADWVVVTALQENYLSMARKCLRCYRTRRLFKVQPHLWCIFTKRSTCKQWLMIPVRFGSVRFCSFLVSGVHPPKLVVLNQSLKSWKPILTLTGILSTLLLFFISFRVLDEGKSWTSVYWYLFHDLRMESSDETTRLTNLSSCFPFPFFFLKFTNLNLNINFGANLGSIF